MEFSVLQTMYIMMFDGEVFEEFYIGEFLGIRFLSLIQYFLFLVGEVKIYDKFLVKFLDVRKLDFRLFFFVFMIYK